MEQKTAVDFLMNAIQKVHKMDWDLVFIEAKKIEREQMLDIWEQGMNAMNGHNIRFDDYVKDNYGL
jgi:hypothetical protein